jgi:hypothetical protein
VTSLSKNEFNLKKSGNRSKLNAREKDYRNKQRKNKPEKQLRKSSQNNEIEYRKSYYKLLNYRNITYVSISKL